MTVSVFPYKGTNTKPSATMISKTAKALGCTVNALKAVIEVEAAGKWYKQNLTMVRRFEPHKLSKSLQAQIGWSGNWRASLKLKLTSRRRLFEEAFALDPEATMRASSWGAFQIMGFNHKLAGYPSAKELVYSYQRNVNYQLTSFASFVVSVGADKYLRAQDWERFAGLYNGTGQAAVYGRKIEKAFNRHSGGKGSSVILRSGSTGASVTELQKALRDRGYDVGLDGHFGPQTLSAVRKYQGANNLPVDGMVGQRTWTTLQDEAVYRPTPEPMPNTEDNLMDKIAAGATIASGGSGAASMFLDGAGDGVRIALIVVVAVGAFVVWQAMSKKKSSQARRAA